jgi:NAD+ synthase
VLQARNEGRSVAEVATELGRTPEQIERVMRDIDQKRMTTRYLHTSSLLVEPVALGDEVEAGAIG